MELIPSAERNQLFETFRQDAFHLELRDDYAVPAEESPFTRWQSGEHDDFEWFEPWMQLMRKATRGGRTVRRVRVVTKPHSPYIQWEHSVTHRNVRAGEDIRWLPRHELPSPVEFPVGGNDWWLFDDETLAVGHFDAESRVLGSELVVDRQVVAECVRLRDLLWTIATPHNEYKP